MDPDKTDPLRFLAGRFRASRAGRSGGGERDFIMDYRELRQLGNTTVQIQAEESLQRAASLSGGMLKLEALPRDPGRIQRIRLAARGGEEWLFRQIGESPPSLERGSLQVLFAAHAGTAVPEIWQESWTAWCLDKAEAALSGKSLQPFQRNDLSSADDLLKVTAGVLGWSRGESMIRFASCVVCRDSKRLGQMRSQVEKLLAEITHGQITRLEDLGLLEKPRQVMLHGPLRIGSFDLSGLRGHVALTEADLVPETPPACSAERILTVENETSFLELVKRNRGGTLLIQTSYPGRAVVSLLSRLPLSMPAWHFGDTDPHGFAILRDLRWKTGRPIQPLHMNFRPRREAGILTAEERGLLSRLLADPLMEDCRAALEAMQQADTRGDFEQESLGPPHLPDWPYYQP